MKMIPPHPSINMELFKGNRSNSLSLLSPIMIDGIKRCAWCGISESKKKYCSEDCSKFAFIYMNPQSNWGMSFIFESLQMASCVGCGLDYEDYLIEGVKKANDQLKEKEVWMKEYQDKFPEHDFKHPKIKFVESIYDRRAIDQAKKLIPELDAPEIDHIVAIKLGGQGAGFDNLQILCCRCHKEKTKEDNIKISALKKGNP